MRCLINTDNRHANIGPCEHRADLDVAALPCLLDIATAKMKLQRFVLRAGAIVSHDVAIADYVYLGQTSVIGGYSRIETGPHIAPGAIVP